MHDCNEDDVSSLQISLSSSNSSSAFLQSSSTSGRVDRATQTRSKSPAAVNLPAHRSKVGPLLERSGVDHKIANSRQYGHIFSNATYSAIADTQTEFEKWIPDTLAASDKHFDEEKVEKPLNCEIANKSKNSIENLPQICIKPEDTKILEDSKSTEVDMKLENQASSRTKWSGFVSKSALAFFDQNLPTNNTYNICNIKNNLNFGYGKYNVAKNFSQIFNCPTVKCIKPDFLRILRPNLAPIPPLQTMNRTPVMFDVKFGDGRRPPGPLAVRFSGPPSSPPFIGRSHLRPSPILPRFPCPGSSVGPMVLYSSGAPSFRPPPRLRPECESKPSPRAAVPHPLSVTAVPRHQNAPSFALNSSRFCQTRITELWHLLSSNVEQAKETFHGDLWLPPDENSFTIDWSPSDPVRTVLALRTPVWPPTVSKILLICVKKIPRGKDDNCLMRLRDQTRWMRTDLHNHVVAYKSFRQLKWSDNLDYWYLQRHSCEFNLIRFLNSKFYSSAIAELLVRDFFHGLDFLHSQNRHLFHGNLKPSNVLIDLQSDGRLSLLLVDFGFGRLRCPRVGLLRNVRCFSAPPSGHLNDLCWKPPEFFDAFAAGGATPATAAPCFSGGHRYDTPSDMYSAALLTFFMLTKRHPFIVSNVDLSMMHLRRLMHDELYGLDGVDLEVQKTLRPMLSVETGRRPRASEALKQPTCWTAERRLAFLLHAAEVVASLLARGTRLSSALQCVASTTVGNSEDLPHVVVSRVEQILGEHFRPSFAALLLALKFYLDAKRCNEIPTSWTCRLFPTDEYQFWARHSKFFWDLFRIVHNDPEWKASKIAFYDKKFPAL